MSNEEHKLTENITKAKEVLNIQDTDLDSFLEFREQVITDKILDRCSIETIPKRLNSLIQEFLIEQYKLNEDGILKGKKQVSSVSDNGQTVNFQTVGGASEISKNADSFLDENIESLIAYRKMRW